MTITALLLAGTFYRKGPSRRFMYGTIGLLFVNVSIGGTLTNFAAPPILMVAGTWGWDTTYVFSHFGIRAMIAVIANTLLYAVFFRTELARLHAASEETVETRDIARKAPAWVVIVHAIFMVAAVLSAHHPTIVVGILLFFLGVTQVTKEYQEEVRLKEGALVGFFLGGLVILGSYQAWWISPLIKSLGPTELYFGATVLTAFTDNAMITYLASLVVGLSEKAKYAVVAGAVNGGGLTVIANAPNPAGYSILKDYFEKKSEDLEFSAIGLFMGALGPTVVACVLFYGDKLFPF
jgi:Na+/H+ antiporter NhaD/arsenite permease-like protein